MAAEPGIRSDLYNLGAEKESSFNERNSGPAPSFPNVQAYDCTYSLQQEALSDDTSRAVRGTNPPIPGAEFNSTLSFSVYCTGLQTAAGDGVTASATVHGPLWESAVGSQSLTRGTTFVASGSTAAAPIVNQNSPDIAAGTVCIFTQTGYLEGAVVRSVADNGDGTNTLTLVTALSAVPADASVVYGTATYGFTDTGPSGTSLQFRLANQSAENSFEAYGGGCDKWAVGSTEPGQLLSAQFDYKLGSFEDDDTVVGNPTVSAPTLLTKSPWMGSVAYMWEWSGSTTAYSQSNLRPVKTVSCEFPMGLTARRNPNEVWGIGGWNTGGDGVGAITLTTVLDYQWQQAWQEYDANQQVQYYGLMIASGTTAGHMWGVYFDKVHLTAQPTMTDANGILVQTLNLAVSSDAGAVGMPNGETFLVFSG